MADSGGSRPPRRCERARPRYDARVPRLGSDVAAPGRENVLARCTIVGRLLGLCPPTVQGPESASTNVVTGLKYHCVTCSRLDMRSSAANKARCPVWALFW